MTKDKCKLLKFLQKVNLAFHCGYFNTEEKNCLLQDAKTGFLSKQTQSMLQRKLSEYPDELLILDIMDDFRKETKEC
ncbi:hypothetical protein [Clostridium porci]|uniref:hypothetical protein n=1 Tax=Clostridium porci TaxID=2605778 RepID=UPI0012B41710|nr:hypothetical protein [Clostridium porci]